MTESQDYRNYTIRVASAELTPNSDNWRVTMIIISRATHKGHHEIPLYGLRETFKTYQEAKEYGFLRGKEWVDNKSANPN